MYMRSPHDVRYNARWLRGYLEVFHDGKSIGKVRLTTRGKAKNIFETVVRIKAPPQDVVHFKEISQGMIGMDLSKMSYSSDRQRILYQGEFFAYAQEEF